MRMLGRLVVRGKKLTGIFFPFAEMEPGIYSLQEVMGEITIKRIGEPAMDKRRLNALTLDGLSDEKELVGMTAKELSEVKRELGL